MESQRGVLGNPKKRGNAVQKVSIGQEPSPSDGCSREIQGQCVHPQGALETVY